MAIESATALTILDAEPGNFQFSAFRSLHMFIWLQTPSLDSVARLGRALEVRDKAPRPRVSAVHIITPNVGPPPPEARAAFVELMQRRGELTVCGGVVIERGGLLGVAVRSAVTGIIILAPKHYRVKVFDNIDACAPWISEQHEKVTCEPFSAVEIRNAMLMARTSAL